MNGLFAKTLAALLISIVLTDAVLAADKVTLRVVTPQQYQAELKKHQGKVVLVDFWATWCIPCLKGFPHTVEYHEKYAKQGLVVISVSMDDSDKETQAAALEFLTEQNATFTNLMSSLGGEEAAMKAFGVTGGALPHYKIFNRQGRQVHEFGVDPEKGLSHEAIETAIKKTLATK